MKTEVETLNPTRVRLSVEVPYEELRADVDSAYRRIGEQVNIPGFRKGKVPPRLIDQRFGRGVVLEEAMQGALPRLYGQAVEEAAVEVVGQPEVDVTAVPEVEGGELKFTAEVDVRPEIELPQLSDITVEVETADVTDADIDEQVQGLRERFGSLRPVERAAAADDFLTIDLAASVDGEEIEGLSSRGGLSYQVGSGALLEGLDDALPGLSAGESRTFQTTLVGSEYAGREADVEVTVRSVRERDLPALDDDFAQTASEFDTLSELRDNIRTRLVRAKRVEQVRQARDAVLEAVLARVEVPLPESVVEAEVHGRQHSLNDQLSNAGLTKEQYLQSRGESEADFDNDVAEASRDAVKAQLLLDAVAKQEEFGVAETELTEHLLRRAADLNIPPGEFAQRVMRSNQVAVLMSEVLRGKALAHLVEAATVRDAAGNQIDVSEAAEVEADAIAAGDVDEPGA